MAYSNSNYDWSQPVSFTDPGEPDDSFSSLKSYLESVGDNSTASMNPASLARTDEGAGQEDSQSSGNDSPHLGPVHSGPNSGAHAHNKRKGAAEANTDGEALKDRRSGNRESAVHHTHGNNVESTSAAAKKDGKKRGGAGANTSEKRKEQNRNAQRAFRERREKYARELEEKLQAMTEVADARQAENQTLKELIAHLQAENARATTGGSAGPIPAMANSNFTFSMPAGSSSSTGGSNDGKSPPISSTRSSSANPSGKSPAAFDSLFSQLPATPATQSKPSLSLPASTSQPYESFSDPVLGSFGLPSFASQPSPGQDPTSLVSSSGFTPFSQPHMATPNDLFSTGEFGSYGNLEDLLNSSSNAYGGAGLQPFESQSPAANFDAPTPSSELFANYREPSSSSLFGEPLKGSITSPPPALMGSGPEETDQSGKNAQSDSNRQDSSSSTASTRSASIFNGSTGTPGAESSTSSPPSANTDKPSPASFMSQRSNTGSIDANCPLRDQFYSLRGAQAFDVDALCQDMTKKATCKESMRQALDDAVQQDLDVYAVFKKLGAEKSTRDAYLL